MNTHQYHTVNVKSDAVSNAIHPTTYRGGGFLAHGVLNILFPAPAGVIPALKQALDEKCTVPRTCGGDPTASASL